MQFNLNRNLHSRLTHPIIARLLFTFTLLNGGVSVEAQSSVKNSNHAVTDSKLKLPLRWEYGPPLISPESRTVEPSRAQKDPTVVFHDNKWHLFMTVKLPERSAIEYCSFADWNEAQSAKRTLLSISDSDYFCAPQKFYFRPHRKWYLVYQVGVAGSKKMWFAYSTTDGTSNPLGCILTVTAWPAATG